ncbi:hypothetical protein [Vibrio campbellii]|uniref:hypothetical protein n=1 Tax=Vibrio campbellii TaxID=680 RepID=UPI0005EF140E|nr:hypothetical protein [Vibrio campbellii]
MAGLIVTTKNLFKNTGNSLIKGLRHNPYGISFSENIFNTIRTAIDMADFHSDNKTFNEALLNAYTTCKEVKSIIMNSENHRNRANQAKVEHTLREFSKLLETELGIQQVMYSNLQNKPLTISDDSGEVLDKTAIAIASLNQLSDEVSRKQTDAKLFFKNLEQRALDRTERLVDEAETSLRNRLNDSHENIRSIQQSIRDELDISINRAEERIKKLVADTERKNQIFQADIKSIFQQHEEASTNRIEVRIQRAEALATNLSKQASEAKEHIENIIESESESLQTLLLNSRNSINDSIQKMSTEAAQKVRTTQTEAVDSFNSVVTQNIESINERISVKISDYDELKEKMEKAYKDKVDELETHISIVTSAVMANENLKQAKTENRVYWFLQILGLMFMLAAIYSGSAFFSELTNIRLPFFPKPDLVIHVDGAISTAQNPTILMFMRLSMIILLTAPAVYLLKEAAVHRHKENLYRQRGVQLATISPYLEELEKEERAAIKKELVSSFFQFHDGKADTQNVPDFLRDVKEAANIAKIVNGQPSKTRRFGKN